MTTTMKTGRNIGAAAGTVVFLAFGILPGFYFGSFGTMVIMSHLMSGPVDANILVRMMVVLGAMFGLFCTGAVSVVMGSVFGTAVAYLTELVAAPIRVKDEAVKAEIG